MATKDNKQSEQGRIHVEGCLINAVASGSSVEDFQPEQDPVFKDFRAYLEHGGVIDNTWALFGEDAVVPGLVGGLEREMDEAYENAGEAISGRMAKMVRAILVACVQHGHELDPIPAGSILEAHHEIRASVAMAEGAQLRLDGQLDPAGPRRGARL